MILAGHSRGAGLFSQVNFVVTHIEALGHAEFHVDWTEGTPYAGGSSNVFDELFVQGRRAPEGHEVVRGWPHYRYTGADAAALYMRLNGWRWRLHQCWKHLRVRDDILAEVEAWCGSWARDATALHVRNRKIGTECPGGLAPTLEDYGRALRCGGEPVFLATDNREAVEYFRDLLGDRLVVREIARAADMETEYHLSRPQSARDARECLIDALVMARCGRLIHSVSNIATAVLYINPAMSHIFVTSGCAKYLPPDPPDEKRARVRSIVVRREPCRLIHLDHPQWRDWGLVFEGNVIMRHATGCAGELVAQADGDIEIRWLDWEPEVFRLKEPTDPRFSACKVAVYYALRRSRQVEMVLRGGLGNQLFQYAFGLSVARHLGAKLRVTHDGSNRSYALGAFGIPIGTPLARHEVHLRWEDDYQEGVEEEMIAAVMESDAYAIRIEGWFQNEHFFLPVADEIRRRCCLTFPLPASAGDRTPVAVHVRLGDYLNSLAHAPLPESYYQTAMARMREDLDRPLFLVFSDEPDRCPGFLRDSPDTLVLPALYDFHAFGMMQACKAFILANSTFSWWAAWLSRSECVICPDPFLPDQAWTICPARWMKLRTVLRPAGR